MDEQRRSGKMGRKTRTADRETFAGRQQKHIKKQNKKQTMTKKVRGAQMRRRLGERERSFRHSAECVTKGSMDKKNKIRRLKMMLRQSASSSTPFL